MFFSVVINKFFCSYWWHMRHTQMYIIFEIYEQIIHKIKNKICQQNIESFNLLCRGFRVDVG